MNWDTGSAVTQTRSVDAALLVVVATAAWHLLTLQLPWIADRQGWGPWPWGVALALELSAWALYAAGLHRLTAAGRRRDAALTLVGASAAVVLLRDLAFRFLNDHPEFLLDVSRLAPYLIMVPLVAAWGLVRRAGRWWPLGLLVTGALIFWLQETQAGMQFHSTLQLEAVDAIGAPYAGFHRDLQAAVSWAVGWLAPILAGGLTGWLVERYAEQEPEPAGHP